MKKYRLILYLWISLFATTLIAIDITSDFSIDGHLLGIHSALYQNNNHKSAFDVASNLTVTYDLSKELKTTLQLQGGAGESNLGLQGPSMQVTDLSIEYQLDKTFTLCFGSFDTPFGQETHYLSNNADTFAEVFVLNDLSYEAFAGFMGTLNTLGIKVEKRLPWADIIASISNGSGENAVNEDNNYGTVLQVASSKLLPKTRASFTYWKSDDTADQQSEQSNSFNTNLDAWMLDAVFTHHSHKFSGYLALFTFADNLAATNDKVSSYAVAYSYKWQKYQLGLRISQWTPKDHSGDGQGVSVGIKSPGLNTSRTIDDRCTRYQVAFSYKLKKELLWIAELINDNYAHANKSLRIVSGLNVHF